MAGRAAMDWDVSGRESSELYREPRLVAALDWSALRRGEFGDVELASLDESAAAAEQGEEPSKCVSVVVRRVYLPSFE